jgi:flagellar biosynthesis/type III secretory pathway protein FliH
MQLVVREDSGIEKPIEAMLAEADRAMYEQKLRKGLREGTSEAQPR